MYGGEWENASIWMWFYLKLETRTRSIWINLLGEYVSDTRFACDHVSCSNWPQTVIKRNRVYTHTQHHYWQIMMPTHALIPITYFFWRGHVNSHVNYLNPCGFVSINRMRARAPHNVHNTGLTPYFMTITCVTYRTCCRTPPSAWLAQRFIIISGEQPRRHKTQHAANTGAAPAWSTNNCTRLRACVRAIEHTHTQRDTYAGCMISASRLCI